MPARPYVTFASEVTYAAEHTPKPASEYRRRAHLKRNALILLAAALATSCILQAQTENPLSTEAKQAYTGIKNNLVKMAEKMPEENYSFKPVPEIRTFAALVGHVADSMARSCSAVMGESKSVDAGSKTAKADLVAALKA